ncbi:MAG TPA: hypothetical protein VNJ01_08840 [Bacteriovoracaceae bacterium]|nr:hypothetical protein [Bacteriovoracaceae bacterium]
MKKFIVLLLLSTNVLAAPQNLEVWLLSNPKVTQLLELLNRPDFKKQALTVKLECQAMGDYCFDPQFGLYKQDDLNFNVKVSDDTGPSIPSGKSVDRDLISCDSSNYFDVFCGKAKLEAKPSKSVIDVWVDTSSSMREYDHTTPDGSCHRKSLITKLDQSCGFNQKLNVMMFDTSIKQAGEISSVCNNQGLNDYKKLMDWIERSDAKSLIIITDINEYHKEFTDYVESKHGKIRGDKEPFRASQMIELADQLAKSCK